MIAGPTASGKTSLSLRVAARLGGEIISVDSRQCYRFLDIGTAKPTPEELHRVPHHNISVLDLSEPDSAAKFHDRANEYIHAIESRGKRVIFCGGSTLHLQSLIQPLDQIPETDPEILRELQQRVTSEGLHSLYEELSKADPLYISSMDGMNPQRVLRALAVWKQTGKPFSSFHNSNSPGPSDDLEIFLIHRNRRELHERISRRTDQMIRHGLLDEARAISEKGWPNDLQSLQTVGYREVFNYLNGLCSYEQMIDDINTSTRRYAKRQITWFRKWEFATVLTLSEMDLLKAENEIVKQVAAKEHNP